MVQIDDFSEYETKCRNAHDKNFLNSREPEFQNLYRAVRHSTMLSRERLYNLFSSVQHACEKPISGDIVELGCWRGGAVALALSALLAREKLSDRLVWAFDTFEGHPQPSDDEVDVWGRNQKQVFLDRKAKGEPWADASLDAVQLLAESVCGSSARLRLVKGRAEETLTQTAPASVSILRIDMDWFEPTLAALEILYPRVSVGGVVIIDDYGHHSGAKKAFHQFFGRQSPMLFHIDYSCVTFLKC